MLTFEKYVRPGTTRQAYELLQENRLATVIGGMMWLRLSDRTSPLGIDLSGCGLDKIEETEDAWRIGAMVTLGQLENHERFQAATCGIFTEAVRDIVGTQFRNLATVGGSLYARMGFSDIVTALLSLDTEVELEGAGTMPIIPSWSAGRETTSSRTSSCASTATVPPSSPCATRRRTSPRSRGGRLLAGILARHRGRAPQEGHARDRRRAHPAARRVLPRRAYRRLRARREPGLW